MSTAERRYPQTYSNYASSIPSQQQGMPNYSSGVSASYSSAPVAMSRPVIGRVEPPRSTLAANGGTTITTFINNVDPALPYTFDTTARFSGNRGIVDYSSMNNAGDMTLEAVLSRAGARVTARTSDGSSGITAVMGDNIPDGQPLVIRRPEPTGVVYKPVPVVYEGDRVIVAGSKQFPLPDGMSDSMTVADLSAVLR
jgi:hypothetical protein